MMRFLIITFFLLLSSVSLSLELHEKIYSFHSDIQIQADGSVLVTKKIEVLAMGRENRKGIYRDIPLNFKLPEGTARHVLTVKQVKRNGEEEPITTEMIDGGIRIYMGSSDLKIPTGRHTYELTYELDRTVFCNEHVCSVMWNVNGNHWNFSIDTLSATITTPENVKVINFDGWTGKYGDSNQKDFLTKPLGKGQQLFMTNKLESGHNLTVEVTFDKGVMSELPFSTEMTYYFRDYSLFILGLFGFLVSFMINYLLWTKYGKDPRKGTIIPQFYPPKDWSPAEVLYLLNEGKKDNNMFASQLLQLAVKKRIKIEKGETTKGKDSFVISYGKAPSKKLGLTELDEGFVKALFGKKSQVIIEIGRASCRE